MSSLVLERSVSYSPLPPDQLGLFSVGEVQNISSNLWSSLMDIINNYKKCNEVSEIYLEIFLPFIFREFDLILNLYIDLLKY